MIAYGMAVLQAVTWTIYFEFFAKTICDIFDQRHNK